MLKTSFTIRSAENLLSHIFEYAKVAVGGDRDKTVEKSLSTTKILNETTGYLNSEARKTFI